MSLAVVRETSVNLPGQTGGVGVGGAGSITITHNGNVTGGAANFATGNGVAVSLVVWNNNLDLTSVKIGGVSLVKVDSQDAGAGDKAQVWFLDSAPAGQNTVVIAYTLGDAAGAYFRVGICEVNGPFAPTTANASGKATGTSAAPSATTGATTSTDLLLVGVYSNSSDSTGAASPPATWSQLFTGSGGSDEGGAAARKLDTAATGTRTVTFANGSSINWGCLVVALAAPGGGGGGPTPPKNRRSLLGVGI